MLEFHKQKPKNPSKTDPEKRIKDFQEIYSQFDNKTSIEQSSRCSQCGVPYCQIHCPLNNNIPDWLKYIAEDRLEEAYQISTLTNVFPEVCGRVCPQDRLCEGNCVVEQAGFGAITIGNLEKYLTELAWEKGWVKKIQSSLERKESIGIIGAGPAGLAAGEELRKQGYQITIYDRYDRAGGLLIYGIPNFKLEKEIVQRRTKLLQDSGVEFKLNFNVGKDKSFKELKEEHDAIVIATGVYKSRDINLNKENFSNVIPALEYLTTSNKVGLNDKVEDFDNGLLNASNKNVIVVGGGDTAMDCVRTAIRQGAKDVKCLYRRDKNNMPGSQREVENAIEEGVDFKWLTLPIQYQGNNNLDQVKIAKMELGSPDETGRRKPEIKKNSEEILNADLVIEALGFEPEELPIMFDEPALNVTRWGTLKVNYKNLMTSLDGVFAAGDIVRGASLVVWGIKDGRDAANHIHNYLENNSQENKRVMNE